MTCLICLLEEPSAEEMLKGVLPKILPEDVYPQYLVFEGKQDLEKRMEKRIRLWNTPDSLFLVMRDQDSGNCIDIKNNLMEKIKATGKMNHSIVRIACHELESFYLGDLAAVERGLNLKNLEKKQNKSKFRSPDSLANPAEELFKLTDKVYQKVAGSRAIAPYLKVDESNKSHSFNILIDGIKAKSQQGVRIIE